MISKPIHLGHLMLEIIIIVIRKTIIAFGTLFNDIHVRHTDQAGNAGDLKVRMIGPSKILAKITQQTI